MQHLLHGTPEQEQVAFFKVNRLISNCLRTLDARKFANDFEDVRQRVIFKLVERFRKPPLPEPRAFVNYARVTTRNEFLEFVGKKPVGEELVDTIDTFEDPLAQLARTTRLDVHTRMSLQRCLERLPAHLQEVVVARYIDDLTADQASADTGHPLATFKRRIRTALDLLHECLQGRQPSAEKEELT